MLPDRVSNPGPLTYESDALPIGLRGPAVEVFKSGFYFMQFSCVGLFQKGSFCLNARVRNMP